MDNKFNRRRLQCSYRIDFKTRIGRIKNFFKFSIENCCNRILNNFVTCVNIYPTVRES